MAPLSLDIEGNNLTAAKANIVIVEMMSGKGIFFFAEINIKIQKNKIAEVSNINLGKL